MDFKTQQSHTLILASTTLPAQDTMQPNRDAILLMKNEFRKIKRDNILRAQQLKEGVLAHLMPYCPLPLQD